MRVLVNSATALASAVLISVRPAIAQTASTIQVGAVQLRLGMTVTEVRALVTPTYYLHSPRDQLRLGPLGQGNPALADSTAAVEEQQQATDTTYAAMWFVDRTNAPPWNEVATLYFKAGTLRKVEVSWIPENAQYQGIILVRQLYRLLTNFQTAGHTVCRMRTTGYHQVFPDSLGGEPSRSINLFCGPQHLTIYLTEGPGGSTVGIDEVIGSP